MVHLLLVCVNEFFAYFDLLLAEDERVFVFRHSFWWLDANFLGRPDLVVDCTIGSIGLGIILNAGFVKVCDMPAKACALVEWSPMHGINGLVFDNIKFFMNNYCLYFDNIGDNSRRKKFNSSEPQTKFCPVLKFKLFPILY